MSKGWKKFYITVSVILVIVLLGVIFYPSFRKNEAKDEVKTSVFEAVDVAQSEQATAKTTPAEATTEATSEEVVAEAPPEEKVDVSTLEAAYITDVNQETFENLIENLNNNWDVGVRTKDQFVEDHPEIFGDYPRDENGKIMVLWSDAQMLNQDHDRQYAAKNMGLDTLPINDALDFPNAELTEKDVAAILAARTNQVVTLEKPLEDYEIAIFKDWLSKPVVFEAFINLMLDQKIGSEFTLRDNWTGPTKFVEKFDMAREEGIGVNYWLRCFEDEDGNRYYFLTEEYIYDYVIPFISFVYEQPFSCEVLASRQHYHLIAGDNDILRKAELANYKDSKTAFVWRFIVKDKIGNDRVGLMLGDNVRDGRPEILNYTVIKKPTTTKKTDKTSSKTPTPTSTPTPTPDTPGTPPVVPPGPPDPPGPTPTPTPETKNPSEGSASHGNADTGGGKNDDPGPGPQKPDQGNSKSDKVEDSQYQQGNSENTTEDKTPHDEGPAADNTDNGTPPATQPIEQHDTDYTQPDSGAPASPGNNNGGMAEPPV